MPKIEVNDKTYEVKLATTPEEKEKGLQGVEKLEDNEGMLFIYDEPTEVGYWMKDCKIPLDIIFIDEYGEVISVVTGKPEDETPLEESGVKYVLEVNPLSGIETGDDVDLSEVENEDEETSKLVVLDEKGNIQMELEGGERIFSRPHTKTIVKLSKRAYKSEKDSDYKALGRKVFQFIEKQNTQEPQYTE